LLTDGPCAPLYLYLILPSAGDSPDTDVLCTIICDVEVRALLNGSNSPLQQTSFCQLGHVFPACWVQSGGFIRHDPVCSIKKIDVKASASKHPLSTLSACLVQKPVGSLSIDTATRWHDPWPKTSVLPRSKTRVRCLHHEKRKYVYMDVCTVDLCICHEVRSKYKPACSQKIRATAQVVSDNT
jgi:hypothetical protein